MSVGLRFLFAALAVLLCLGAGFAASAAADPQTPRHVVLVVWDGMRPDFATQTFAPRLAALARDGVRFAAHHSIYPTATDVNGAALATGCYPGANGLHANLEFRPDIDRHAPVDMGDPDVIRRGDEVSGGKYLTRPTAVELLRKAGRKVALAGAKSAPLLFDRGNDWTVGRMQRRPLTIFAGSPISATQRDDFRHMLGPFPDDPKTPAAQRNDFAMRALIDFLWRDGVPDFSLLWLSEPDLAQHNFSPGSPEALAAIKAADENLAAVLSALEKKHVRDSTDVFVVSDHGFSTIRRSIDLVALLNAAGFHAGKAGFDSPAPGDIVVGGNGGSALFYVHEHSAPVIRRLAEWLHEKDFAGAVFTRDGVGETLKLSDVHLDTPGAADVILSFAWGNENPHGNAPGIIDADWNRKPGEGTHATLSPFDVHNTLVAGGPHLRRGFTDESPSGNVDLAPTILSLLGVEHASDMDGRVLDEAFARSTSSAASAEHRTIRSRFEELTLSSVAGHTYIDRAQALHPQPAN